jgi:hypothetical protein
VFGAKVVVLMPFGLFAREDDDFPASIGESLEHSGPPEDETRPTKAGRGFELIVTTGQLYVKRDAGFWRSMNSILG